MNVTKWSALALVGVLLAADFADACGRGGRRGRRGGCGGGGCGSATAYCYSGTSAGYHHASGYYDSRGRFSYYPPEQALEQGDLHGTIHFRSAPDARIWVNDQLIEGTGAARTWRLPTAVREGQSFTVRAQWTENGKQRNETRTVTVQPGTRMNVDFSRPESVPPPRPQNERPD